MYNILVKRRAMNTQDIYAKMYEQQISDKSLIYVPSEHLIRALYLMGANNPQNINSRAIDIGCGNGRHCKLLSSLDYKVIGTDVTKSALNLSKTMKYQTQVDFIECKPNLLIKDPSITKYQYDLIVCWETIHWLGSKQLIIDTLSSAKQLIKEDGNLIFTFVREDDYRILNSTPVKDSHGCKIISSPERKDCIIYQEAMEDYEALIKELGLTIKYLGWYIWQMRIKY